MKQRLFFIFSILVLAGTTVYWSVLSAIVQHNNADQLADPALFTSWDTFSHSIFPTQHTFLLKWPLFWAVQATGGSETVYIIATVLISLLAIGALAWLLTRIEKRLHVRGLLFLALSSALLLVPIEPQPGSLLPVGMGMLATRNLEYIVFIGAAWLAIKGAFGKHINGRGILAVVLFMLLFVTDQLFVGLSLAGGALFMVYAMIARKPAMRWAALRIFTASIIAAALGVLALYGLRKLGLIDTPTGAAGPYGIVTSAKDLAVGSIYAITGLTSQFGANPVSSTVVVADLPRAALQSVHSFGIVGYLINGVLALAALMAAIRIIVKPSNKKQPAQYLTLYIIAATIASVGLFVLTKHYYPADARYVGLALFAGFLAIATQTPVLSINKRLTGVLAAILMISCASGIYASRQNYVASQQAYQTSKDQTALIARALEHHPVDTLVADYWRAFPIVTASNAETNPLPLDDCFAPRQVLTSTSWQQHVYAKSFAYLLTTERTATGFPACDLASAHKAFGSPSDTLVVSGTAANPETMLLFYDNGINHKVFKRSVQANANSLLRNLNDLDDTACSTGNNVMQTVAHQDDDLLFMNPDLQASIKQGDCIRTVYFTAGDAGSEQAYWLAREEGAKAAYAQLLNVTKPDWRSRDVQLARGHQVKIAQLQNGKTRVSLVFMRLPDGNMTGNGFSGDRMESLHKLADDVIPEVHSVDKTSSYSKVELVSTLLQLMDHYRPSAIRSQATSNSSAQFPDHSDHIAVGRLASDAYQQYLAINPSSTIAYYIGYPIRERPENVAGEDLLQKQALFYAYAGHDQSTCTSNEACEYTAYRDYLSRQYTE